MIQIPHPAEGGKPFWIVSNDLQAPAGQIADLYKQRWQVELLFKWLKQNLKIKRFVGQSHNAILIQIYTAIIAYVLLTLLKRMTKSTLNRLKDVGVLIKTSLFSQPTLNPPKTKPTLTSQLSWSFP
ncbi:MAG: transposase [Alphaproteobacteria bacterium]|nr:transposase [Alphaproteobacteria bacterium]OJV46298.1 MAG: hypothetical protein BGO28_02935 [Alphaproteobacteria bacterium 43-37]